MTFIRRFCFLVIISIGVVLSCSFRGAAEEPLLVFCGAGLMKPMDEIKVSFEEETGLTVRIVYGGSGELFGMISTRKEGDVYIPGAEKYIEDALREKMIVEDEITVICYHVPVILVPKGNPAQIHSLADLAKPGLRLALADEKAAAIGKTGKAILEKNALYEDVKKNVVVKPGTTNQLLMYVATSQVDGAIAWHDQSTWAQADQKVEIVSIPITQNSVKTIPAAIISYSKRTDDALAFIKYLVADSGKIAWKRWGFPLEKPVE